MPAAPTHGPLAENANVNVAQEDCREARWPWMKVSARTLEQSQAVVAGGVCLRLAIMMLFLTDKNAIASSKPWKARERARGRQENCKRKARGRQEEGKRKGRGRQEEDKKKARGRQDESKMKARGRCNIMIADKMSLDNIIMRVDKSQISTQ